MLWTFWSPETPRNQLGSQPVSPHPTIRGKKHNQFVRIGVDHLQSLAIPIQIWTDWVHVRQFDGCLWAKVSLLCDVQRCFARSINDSGSAPASSSRFISR